MTVMKKNIIMSARLASLLSLFCCFGFCMMLSGCKEEIDDSNFTIKTEQTLADYMAASPNLSCIKAIFDRVKLGSGSKASSLTSVLSARGNYTVFAPTNAAVVAYVQAQTGSSDVNSLPYELAELVAKSCIIDNGNNEAYETADFPQNNESFALSNLNDRRLTSLFANDEFTINGNAKVVQENIDLSNGMMHVVSTVIAPSNDLLPDLIKQAPNMKIISRLIQETGWAAKMQQYVDLSYENDNTNLAAAGTTKRFASFDFPYMDKKAVGYTAFVEPDEVYKNEWGVDILTNAEGEIENWDDVLQIIKTKCDGIYGAVSADVAADLTNEDNPVNRFVAYHLLKGNMASDEFVHHYNEAGYSFGKDKLAPQTTNLPVDVWDYYTTMGKHRGLLKLTQLANESRICADGEAGGFYLNRISEYRNGIPFDDVPTEETDYKEVSTEANAPGINGINIKINLSNNAIVEVDESGNQKTADNNALNGFYYPIDHILVYDNVTRSRLASERMRIDLVTMLPELFDNDIRGMKVRYFPNNYFENIKVNSSVTQIYYLQEGRVAHNGAWKDYQGDEFLFSGKYDFVLKLPPVPQKGNYEIRMGFSMNELRGMFQAYIGESPDNTQPVSLPIDLREQVSQIPGQPWVDDATASSVAEIMENDRNLRNQNYMKGPQYIYTCGETTTIRNATPTYPALRRILGIFELDPEKTYYLRFKSVMESSETQFQVDYFELVPTSVITDPTNPEDIW